jgi:Tfp pilus assembly protein PilN
MTDSRKTDGKSDKQEQENAVLMKRLSTLEQDIIAINIAKKRKNVFGLIGGILIILALVMFLMNISSFFKNKVNSADFRNKMLKQGLADMQDLKSNPNLKKAISEIKNDVLPALAKEVITRFKAEIPSFKAQGDDFLQELKVYLEKDVKERMEKSLLAYLVKVEGTLKDHYPDLSVDDLNKIVKSSQAIFIIELEKVIQNKLKIIQDDLVVLKTSKEQFKLCEEYKSLDASNPHSVAYAKQQLIVSMLELVIYHIDPERGKVPYLEIAGGVK